MTVFFSILAPAQRKFTHFAGPACGHIHGHGKKAKGLAEAEEEEKKEKDRQKEMKVLELLIKARRKALENYKARQEALYPLRLIGKDF